MMNERAQQAHTASHGQAHAQDDDCGCGHDHQHHGHQHGMSLGLPAGQARSLKVGRNDPCPCGSGQKFKKCCIDKISG